jgi:hypothetical protein
MGALYTNLLAEMPELVDAMGASTRVGYALKTMLTDETAAGRALELTGAIAQMSEQPLVLQLPSPLRWLAQTHELAGAGSRVDIELHYGERVSAYVADWLRWLSSLPVSLLLLDGRRADLPVVRLDVSAAYAPITQVADYYDWSLGQWTDNGVEIVGAELKGAAVPREYWLSEDVAVPLGDFRIAEIPGEAELETVLARLAALG